MAPNDPDTLSRREREIVDILHARGEASAAEIQAEMTDAPSYSAVRGLLRVLLEKGHAKAKLVGNKNVYRATRSRVRAGKKALSRALDTFYGGDVRDAVAALLDVSSEGLSENERDRLMDLIEKAREGGR